LQGKKSTFSRFLKVLCAKRNKLLAGAAEQARPDVAEKRRDWKTRMRDFSLLVEGSCGLRLA
jgi:hypothetical protein